MKSYFAPKGAHIIEIQNTENIGFGTFWIRSNAIGQKYHFVKGKGLAVDIELLRTILSKFI